MKQAYTTHIKYILNKKSIPPIVVISWLTLKKECVILHFVIYYMLKIKHENR